MVWLIGIGCLALGLVLGAVFANRLGGSPARIKELESQVKGLEERHDLYKGDVSEHFNVTADLVQQMTQSYRDVYQHLATGAQDLCSTEVANKLLPVGSDAVFDTANPREEALGFNPPKDYATKQNPGQKGALAEDFGIEKTKPEESSPYKPATGQAADEESWKVSEYRPEGKGSNADDELQNEGDPEEETGEKPADEPSSSSVNSEARVKTADAPESPSSPAEADSPVDQSDESDEEQSAQDDAKTPDKKDDR